MSIVCNINRKENVFRLNEIKVYTSEELKDKMELDLNQHLKQVVEMPSMLGVSLRMDYESIASISDWYVNKKTLSIILAEILN